MMYWLKYKVLSIILNVLKLTMFFSFIGWAFSYPNHFGLLYVSGITIILYVGVLMYMFFSSEYCPTCKTKCDSTDNYCSQCGARLRLIKYIPDKD